MPLNRKCLRFGNFRLYPTEHLLLREETALSLAPKAFEILLYLVKNTGHLVKREELMQVVWPDSFVEETNLTVNISLLRKLLGESEDGQSHIATVPRKGYRFQATVEECDEADELGPSDDATRSIKDEAEDAADLATVSADTGMLVGTTSAAAVATPVVQPAVEKSVVVAESGGFWQSWARIALTSVAVLVLLGVGIFFWARLKSKPTVVSASNRSMAILPFRPLGAAPQDEYLGLGMADALITRLGSVQRIVVRPVGAVRKYANADDPLAAGRQLAVDNVLEGSIQRSGNRTRVTVRLLRVADGELLWGSEFDENITDMFAVEDSISQKVASALIPNLSGDEQRRLSRPFTANSDAYQLYMRGRFFWNKRTADGVRKSLEYFQQAIQADPNYALAYAGLADSYTLAGSYGYSILPPKEAMPKAEAAAQQALAIDDSLAEAHTSLAYLKFTYDWDWNAAQHEFERAIALNPGYDNAHHWYSHLLMARGRQNESLAEARRALELSPSDTVMNEHIGWTYLMMRDYDNAIQSCRKALDMDPDFLLAHRVLGMAYLYKGQNDDAVAEFQRGVQLSHDDPVAEAYLARAYAAARQNDKAITIVDRQQQRSGQRYIPPVEVAAVYSALGDSDHAFQWLNRAVEDRSSALVYLNIDRAYDAIRGDPRFAQLLRKVHLN
jgi:DNA-binding winged helix-turn-helix (wHTH) protein/TolB-like protein/lipopolysaccharide biosynthesis regulator YciM